MHQHLTGEKRDDMTQDNSIVYDAIVTDANQRLALEIVRSLGETHLRVLTVERRCFPLPPAHFSRYTARRTFVSSWTDQRFFALVRKARVLIPVSTNTIYSFL